MALGSAARRRMIAIIEMLQSAATFNESAYGIEEDAEREEDGKAD